MMANPDAPWSRTVLHRFRHRSLDALPEIAAAGGFPKSLPSHLSFTSPAGRFCGSVRMVERAVGRAPERTRVAVDRVQPILERTPHAAQPKHGVSRLVLAEIGRALVARVVMIMKDCRQHASLPPSMISINSCGTTG